MHTVNIDGGKTEINTELDIFFQIFQGDDQKSVLMPSVNVFPLGYLKLSTKLQLKFYNLKTLSETFF